MAPVAMAPRAQARSLSPPRVSARQRSVSPGRGGLPKITTVIGLDGRQRGAPTMSAVPGPTAPLLSAVQPAPVVKTPITSSPAYIATPQVAPPSTVRKIFRELPDGTRIETDELIDSVAADRLQDGLETLPSGFLLGGSALEEEDPGQGKSITFRVGPATIPNTPARIRESSPPREPSPARTPTKFSTNQKGFPQKVSFKNDAVKPQSFSSQGDSLRIGNAAVARRPRSGIDQKLPSSDPQILVVQLIYLSGLPPPAWCQRSPNYILSVHAGTEARADPPSAPDKRATKPAIPGKGVLSLEEEQLRTRVREMLDAKAEAEGVPPDTGLEARFNTRVSVRLSDVGPGPAAGGPKYFRVDVWRQWPGIWSKDSTHELWGRVHVPIEEVQWHRRPCTWPVVGFNNEDLAHLTLEFAFAHAPTQVSALEVPIKSVTSTEVSLKWVPPADDVHAPVTRYRVELCALHRGGAAASMLPDQLPWRLVCDDQPPSSEPSAIARGLKGDTLYRLRVRPINEAGLGDPAEVEALTAPVAPGVCGQPRLCGCQGPVLTIEWTPPADDGGSPIVLYRVWIRPFSTLGSGEAAGWFDLGLIEHSDDNDTQRADIHTEELDPAVGRYIVSIAAISQAELAGPATPEAAALPLPNPCAISGPGPQASRGLPPQGSQQGLYEPQMSSPLNVDVTVAPGSMLARGPQGSSNGRGSAPLADESRDAVVARRDELALLLQQRERELRELREAKLWVGDREQTAEPLSAPDAPEWTVEADGPPAVMPPRLAADFGQPPAAADHGSLTMPDRGLSNASAGSAGAPHMTEAELLRKEVSGGVDLFQELREKVNEQSLVRRELEERRQSMQAARSRCQNVVMQLQSSPNDPRLHQMHEEAEVEVGALEAEVAMLDQQLRELDEEVCDRKHAYNVYKAQCKELE